MYQCNGWIVLRDSPGEPDDDQITTMVRQVREFIASITWFNGFVDLRHLNGETFVTIAGHTNHRGSPAADLDRLLDLICRVGPGSYGLVYEWDDETREWPGPRAFTVRVLRRGHITVQGDPFLSPTVPLIEDE